MRYLLLLFLTGCAANQSAVPLPPPFNPMTDAPITIGHPGTIHPGPRIEPNPKPTRVLPQTPETRREAGIWAASLNPDWKEQPILDVLLPPPEGETDFDRGIRWSCVVRVARHATAETELRGTVPYSEAERRCMAARMLWTCVDDNLTHFESLASEDINNMNLANAVARHRKLEAYVADMAARMCRGVALSGDSMAFMNAVAKRRRFPSND